MLVGGFSEIEGSLVGLIGRHVAPRMMQKESLYSAWQKAGIQQVLSIGSGRESLLEVFNCQEVITELSWFFNRYIPARDISARYLLKISPWIRTILNIAPGRCNC